MRFLGMLLVVVAVMIPAVMTALSQEAPPGVSTNNDDEKKAEEPKKLENPAMSLKEAENWVKSIDIIVAESMPPQFFLEMKVTMPTPGWKLKVDEVGKPDADGRIKVKVTGTRPEGMVAQVLTDETFNVPVGSIEAGSYMIEVWYRGGENEEYARKSVHMLSVASK